jgi:hypothetical protein
MINRKKKKSLNLKDAEVISEKIAPAEDKFLSISTVTYPLPNDGNVPFISRNIANEGYWLPEIPLHKPSNVFRVENRLLWADPDRQHYFGADGHIRTDTHQKHKNVLCILGIPSYKFRSLISSIRRVAI